LHFTCLVLAYPGGSGQNPDSHKTVVVIVVVKVLVPLNSKTGHIGDVGVKLISRVLVAQSMTQALKIRKYNGMSITPKGSLAMKLAEF